MKDDKLEFIKIILNKLQTVNYFTLMFLIQFLKCKILPE